MAEEEKVIVAEVSNEALNQLKKAFEPTAEEKFEAKRIKAALAGGGKGAGAGVAGAAAGMFGKKGGGFFKGLGKWLALPAIIMAGTIMKMGKGAWNMLTKMIKIIFWPIRWLLGMTGSKAIKDVGTTTAKVAKGGGIMKMFGMILKPFVWITSAWAFIEGWLAAPDRDKDGIVSTYEKFLGGLEEVLKWLSFGFVDFSTFEKLKEKWATFSFEKWVDDMIIAFGKFPDDLADWMNSKTRGLGTFVAGFGKILKEFLFGKEGTEGTKATGGVMGWMAENLSADKVAGAIIGGIKLAVAFGGMLLTMAQYALVGKDGKHKDPNSWSSTSIFGFIHHELVPRLPEIAKGISKTILALLEWIGNIVGQVTKFVGDELIRAGEAKDANWVQKHIAETIKARRVAVAQLKRDKETEALREAIKAKKKEMWEAEGRPGSLEGYDPHESPESRYNLLAYEKGLPQISMWDDNVLPKDFTKEDHIGLPKKPSLSADDITKPSFLTKILGGKAITLDFPTKDEFEAREVAKRLRESRQGPALFVEKARQLDTKHRDVTERNPLGWGAWFNMSANMKSIANRMSKVYSLKGWGDLALSSGWRKNDPGATQALLTNKAGDLKGLAEKWRTLPGMTDEMLAGGSNSEGRRAAVKLLMKHGFTSSHQHGGGIDFNYPPGFTKARPGNLKQMFESMFPGSYLLPEQDHLHLQLPQPISSGAGALQQGMLLNDAWNTFMSGQAGGTTIINNNTNVDQSANTGGPTLIASNTEGHTSNMHDREFLY